MIVQVRVKFQHQLREYSDFAINSSRFIIHGPQKPISYFSHEHGKAKEQIAFKVLIERIVFNISEILLVRPETIVDNCQYFIHSLHISYARVQLAIYKKHSREHICVSLNIV